MRGGARVNSGPAPDPDALRRDRPADKDGWRTLPGPRSEPAPAWPLLADVNRRAERAVLADSLNLLEEQLEQDELATRRRKPSAAAAKKLQELQRRVTVLDYQIEEQTRVELEVWAELWKSPQAHAWAELGWSRDVAQYVRHKVLAEMGSLDDAKEARQWSDRLGLNPASLLRNRWRVATGFETASRKTAKTTAARRRPSSRDRLRVVPGGSEA